MSAAAATSTADRARGELGARRWQQPVLEAFQMVTESLVWFVVVGVMATSAEKTFLEDLFERTELLKSTEIGSQREAAETASALVLDALDGVSAGPPYPVFLLAAIGGFLLVRLLARARITGAFSGLVIVIVTILALNVLLHLALAGDIAFWDSGGLARFLDHPGRYFAGSFDVEAFVADPELPASHGAALTASAVGVFGCWTRFMWLGRNSVGISNVLRSFTVGFALMIVAIVFARLEGIGSITVAAIPYFVLGVLTMAAAQAARATFGVEGVRKTTPWVISMVVTGVTLLAVGSLLGLLALLDAKSLLQVAGGIIGAIVEFLLLLILTPIFWIVEPILRFFFPDGLGGLFDIENAVFGEPGDDEVMPEENDPIFTIPSWFRPLMQFVGLSALLLVFFIAARRIVRRRGDDSGEYEELRERMDGAPKGVGSLLRNLLGRGGGRTRDREWLERHAIYRLFARAEYDTTERGLARFEGETPVEFTSLASRQFDEPLFARIGEEFDRARYGRHYADDDELRPLAEALQAWETANPPTEEMRNRFRGATPLGEAEDFRFRLDMARRRARGLDGPDTDERLARY
jgi:hypothetical protein